MRILVTGSAGFIGYHVAARLLEHGHVVTGLDGMTEYYDPRLKDARSRRLRLNAQYSEHRIRLEDRSAVSACVRESDPEVVIHLAAQAGVRYSLEDPDAYIQSNVVGTQSLLHALAGRPLQHILFASTSSVYGGNGKLPFSEGDGTDWPLSPYAATKRAGEAMLHSFAHLNDIPVTCFRFFTVYGPWGRPDMALFKFVEAIKDGRAIDLYGHGEMERDFTYIDDLVDAVERLITAAPGRGDPVGPVDSVSPVAPWRVVNIGAGRPVGLMDFIEAVQSALGTRANVRYLPLQPGDPKSTHADTSLIRLLTGWAPRTSVRDGVSNFVRWYEGVYMSESEPRV